MRAIANCIIIGLGSIGKRHYENMLKRQFNLFVLDTNPLLEKHDSVLRRNENFFVSSQETLSLSEEIRNSETLVIVANWATNHDSALLSLVECGWNVTKVLVEKPLGSSLRAIEKIERACEKLGIDGIVNFHHRYSKLNEVFRKCVNEQSLGQLEMVSVHGGAKCLSTNGVHWLDFAMQHTNSNLAEVSANISWQNINPRSPNLRFLEGFASWKFESGFTIQINYTNRSSISDEITFYWSSARAQLFSGEFTLGTRKVTDHQKITQTGTFSEVWQSQNLFTPENIQKGMNSVYEILLEGRPSIRDYSESSKFLIYALISSAEKRVVGHAELTELLQKYADVDWVIS